MLRISCPICGTRDEVEFNYGGDASIKRPDIADMSLDVWTDFLFKRKNIKGNHKEYWHHASGCRQWIVVERDTLTHDIKTTELARNHNEQLDAVNKDSS